MELIKSIGEAVGVGLFIMFSFVVYVAVFWIAVLMCASPFILAYLVLMLILEHWVAAIAIAIAATSCLLVMGKLSISISINK